MGAPSPPAAMSRERKSLTTAQPASSAAKSPSPSWRLAAPLGSSPSWCHTVCPWLPTRSSWSPLLRASARAAAPKARPRSRERSAVSRKPTASPSRAARTRPRSSAGKGSVE